MQRMLIALTLLLLVPTGQLKGDDEEAEDGSARAGEVKPQMKAELEEIDDIRDRLGINLFKGTVLENGAEGGSAANQFLEIYRRLARKRGPHAVRPISDRVEGPALQPRPRSNDVELFYALIEAGRQLDLSAARREAAGSFEEANRLRKLGKKIRKLLPEIDAEFSVREANHRLN